MDDIAELESRYAAAQRESDNAETAVNGLISAGGQHEAVLAALENYRAAIDRSIAAKRALDDAYTAREIALEPPPHAPGTPEEEAAWEARLDDEWRDAYSRVRALRADYDALAVPDLSRLDDASLPSDERDAIYDAEEKRMSVVIPLLNELDQAERDLKNATSALTRLYDRGDGEG